MIRILLMGIREEFETGLRKYAGLMLLWTLATVLELAALVWMSFSFAVGLVMFYLGGITLGAAGLGCAYTIARDNI